MPSIVHGFDWPDRVVVGTVGAPGERSFYLQARAGARIIAVALEKQQSAALAEKIDELLDALADADDTPISIPAGTPAELVDNDPLEQPVDPQFRTGVISLGWDPATAQVVIEAYPIVDAEPADYEDVPEPDEVLLVRIPVGTARAFAKRTLEIVGAGRALCPLCGEPMDSDGHVCP
ncbi:MAG: DUF3090 domain-containing protein [Actinomycetota bacterium]